jgi:hypothetical protein
MGKRTKDLGEIVLEEVGGRRLVFVVERMGIVGSLVVWVKCLGMGKCSRSGKNDS